MRRILFVSNSSFSMYFFRKGILCYLISQKYEVHVIAPRDYKTEDLKQLGCIFHELNFHTKNTNPLKDFRVLIGLYKLYRSIRPEIIFQYTIKPNIYGSLAAKLNGIKSIAVITGLGYAFLTDNWINKLVQFMYKASLRYSESTWFLNTDDLTLFTERKIVSTKKAFILPGEGVNTSEFLPVSTPTEKPQRIFLMIARVLWDKGIREYVEAARLVKKEFPQARFQLLGATDADNPSAVPGSMVMEWQSKGYIEYLGLSTNVKKEISLADCIVLPSYREGISKVLMEAASMARPLIASNVTGCRELIDEGINGYLCEVKDTISLAGKMKKILELSSDDLLKMGNAGREKMIREFDEEKIIQIYMKEINA